MNILVIIANPSLKSFSFQILQKLENLLKKSKINHEVIDLYRDKKQQSFYSHNKNKGIKYFQEKISNADEILFIHPIYWCGPPAILKNFLDVNFNEGFAYRYVDDQYEPLLKDKSIRLIVTSNESEEVYREIGNPFLVAWNEFALGTGMELKQVIHIGNMRVNMDKREEILKKIRKELIKNYN